MDAKQCKDNKGDYGTRQVASCICPENGEAVTREVGGYYVTVCLIPFVGHDCNNEKALFTTTYCDVQEGTIVYRVPVAPDQWPDVCYNNQATPGSQSDPNCICGDMAARIQDVSLLGLGPVPACVFT